MSIKFTHVSHVYAQGTSLEHLGLDDVTFELATGKFIALVGHTGSGKSTLMQHFNALLKPTQGEIEIANMTITPDTGNKHLKSLRKQVSLVFQFPEGQLFEQTVREDIAFGPENFGYSKEEALALADEWLKKVGLAPEFANKSPFELSGGQMRRVAIAGVMAYEPAVLCLDEPAAGLDPASKRSMMKLFKQYQQLGHTVILVTHNMDDVAEYADDVLVLEQGKLIAHDTPAQIFADADWLKKHHLGMPKALEFQHLLAKQGFQLDSSSLTEEQLIKNIVRTLKGA